VQVVQSTRAPAVRAPGGLGPIGTPGGQRLLAVRGLWKRAESFITFIDINYIYASAKLIPTKNCKLCKE